MAKITIADITSGFASISVLNDNFNTVELNFNDKVLYRNNPPGEPNQMANDLDMNSNDILNANAVDVQALSIGGTNVTTTELAETELPVQATHNNKFLTTNGTVASWVHIDIRIYDTVAAMKADTTLIVGQTVETKGYLTVGDGGRGFYTILTTGAITVDGQGDHTLTNTFIAQLITERANIRQYGCIPTATAAANNLGIIAAIAAKDVLYIPAGNYTFTGSIDLGSDIQLIGEGRSVTTFTADSTIGQNNLFEATSEDDIKISGITFDMRNDIITPVLTDGFEENAITFVSCKRVEIRDCKFTRALQKDIAFNGAALAENEDIFIINNEADTGSKGFIQVRRYGKNIHIIGNTLLDTVDSAIGGVAFEKPIDVSGTITVWIMDNHVTQTNGEGGSVIVEFVDRASENVHICNNFTTGQAGGNNIKVGAASNVWVIGNTCKAAGSAGIFIEGCTLTRVKDNSIFTPQEQGIRAITDSATTFINKQLFIENNHFEDCNQGAATLGAPTSGGAAAQSFAISVEDDAEVVEITRNKFKDSGATFNGMNIIAVDYLIKNNNFTDLGAGRITVDNHFAATVNPWKIIDNIQAQTTDRGTATILTGNTEVTVVPDTLVEGTDSIFFADLITDMRGDSAYKKTEAAANQQFKILVRTSGHGTPVTNTGAIGFNWNSSVIKPNGIFGKTTH